MKHWSVPRFSICTLLISLLAFAPIVGHSSTADENAVSIGVVLSVTGKEGKPGQYQKEGIETAIKKINDAGGVFVKDQGKKLPFKVVFYDDESDAAKSASLAER